jgi:hypothetical protein
LPKATAESATVNATDGPLDLIERPALREVLRAARRWGVSPARFLGWEPKVTVTYEYGANGRIARTVTTTEPEWNADSRELAMALERYEAGCCSGCGDHLSITTKPENEDRYRAGPGIRCHRCTATAQMAQKYEDAPYASALVFPVELREPVE